MKKNLKNSWWWNALKMLAALLIIWRIAGLYVAVGALIATLIYALILTIKNKPK